MNSQNRDLSVVIRDQLLRQVVQGALLVLAAALGWSGGSGGRSTIVVGLSLWAVAGPLLSAWWIINEVRNCIEHRNRDFTGIGKLGFLRRGRLRWIPLPAEALESRDIPLAIQPWAKRSSDFGPRLLIGICEHLVARGIITWEDVRQVVRKDDAHTDDESIEQ